MKRIRGAELQRICGAELYCKVTTIGRGLGLAATGTAAGNPSCIACLLMPARVAHASEMARLQLEYWPSALPTLHNDMFFQELTLENTHALNAGLYARFIELVGTDRIRQTHYFAGRFENSYIKEADIPEITSVLALVKQQAARHLGLAVARLRAGFWFNAMGPGQRTLPHHHDENDELLSAVYYIRVPENSGDLILHNAGNSISIRPQEGKLVLFAPTVLHEVTTNLSPELRLSVAMNIGPADGGYATYT